MTYRDYLGTIDFFQGFDAPALTVIAQAAREQCVARDTMLFHQDDPATTCAVLIAGQARLIQITPEGSQVILGFIGPGQMVGIIAAIEHATYPLTLHTVTDCTILAWDRGTLVDLLERFPLLSFRALQMVAGRFVQLQNQHRELATERVERRIARALLRLVPQMGRTVADGVIIDLRLSRQDLADLTGTTLYTVSRTLSQWEKQELVTSGRTWVLIRSLPALAALAEDLPPPPDGPFS